MKLVILGPIFLLLFTAESFAELIQILHTNDLHSHLEHAPHRPELGGYARIKVLIDQHRERARLQGIGTIAMDGGDTMEGNLYYMANKGRRTLEAFNRIGYDVSVLGNHDYLMAADDLEGILRDVPPAFSLLAANFKMGEKYPSINRHLKPVWETEINGVKIGVVGITLNDMLYKWRIKGTGKIQDEAKSARKWAKYLRDRGNHIVIALTHIGKGQDIKLAKKVPELDLIVGGHSHDAIQEVIYQESKNGKKIPIVQAGKYGEWLGKIILDYDKAKKTMKVKEYVLMPTLSEDRDPAITALIKEANQDLFALYGKEWLEEIVGKSSLRPIHQVDDQVIWHFFINDSMLEATHADFAVHTQPLSGENYPIGDVTRRSIYEGNPRTFEFSRKLGYNVYTASINGMLIKLVATSCMNLNVPLYFSGITFKWKKRKNGKYLVWDIKHKGERIKNFKNYRVAFSEAIVRGGYGITPLVRHLLRFGERAETSMWEAIEEKFRREGVITPDYLDRYYRRGFVGDDVREMERVMIPVGKE